VLDVVIAKQVVEWTLETPAGLEDKSGRVVCRRSWRNFL